jgi:hypothetical protein
MKKRSIAAIAFVAALVAGTAAWLIAPGERVETVTEVLTNSVTKVVEKKVTEVVAIGKTDRTESIVVFSTDRKVKVETKLAKGSPAAHLQLVFRDADGKILWEERWTVKKSRKAAVKVPQGAASATLSAGRIAGDAPSVFDVFALKRSNPDDSRREAL